MNLVLPIDGDTANVWDVVLDTAFGLIDAHDHTATKGTQVPTAGININANLTFGGFAALHGGFLNLDEQAGPPLLNKRSIYTKTTDHNLYWFNSAGVEVQITAGNILNVAIVGGIGGDYSAVGALLSYDDATRRYLLQQEGAPRPWAGLATADIDLYEKAASIVNRVRLKSPGALAASYTNTWPAALPAHTVPIQCDAAGNLFFSDVFPTTTTMVAGLFKNNVVDAINIPAAEMDLNSNARVLGAQGMKMAQLNGGNAVTFPIRLHPNETIDAYAVQIIKNTNAATTVHARLYTVDSAGVETAQGAGSSDNSNAGGAVSLIESPALGVVVPALGQAFIAVWATGGGVTDNVINCVVSPRRA